MKKTELTEIREVFEELAVQCEKNSRSFKVLEKFPDQEERHAYCTKMSRLADRYEDAGRAIAQLQRELGELS